MVTLAPGTWRIEVSAPGNLRGSSTVTIADDDPEPSTTRIPLR
jgi:hypothetical protein